MYSERSPNKQTQLRQIKRHLAQSKRCVREKEKLQQAKAKGGGWGREKLARESEGELGEKWRDEDVLQGEAQADKVVLKLKLHVKVSLDVFGLNQHPKFHFWEINGLKNARSRGKWNGNGHIQSDNLSLFQALLSAS